MEIDPGQRLCPAAVLFDRAHFYRLVIFHRDRVIRIENVPIW